MKPLVIPYRLETLRDIREATRACLLGLEERHFIAMLRLARGLCLEKPDALLRAKPVATREFFTLRRETVRSERAVIEEALMALPLVFRFQLIEGSIPWAREVAGQEDLFSCLKGLIPNGAELFGLDAGELTPIRAYHSGIQIRRALKRQLLHYARTGRPKGLDRDDLKKTLVALVLFDPRNEDLLKAFRVSMSENREDIYQNALAELLFRRIPSLIEGATLLPAHLIRGKFIAKLESMKLRANHRTHLLGYFPPEARQDEMAGILERIGSVIAGSTIAAEQKKRLADYVQSLRLTIDRGSILYRSLFLNSDLENMRLLHRSVPLLQTVVRYEERIVQTHMQSETLSFYPTKDYFDLCKGLFSNDCVDLPLSKRQLKVRNHFNIRIFEGKKDGFWIGNLYFLDMTRENGCLILDRIQIPREMKRSYRNFFAHLRDVLWELFEDVDYTAVLAPLAISNHAAIQKLFNTHHKALPSGTVPDETPYDKLFESLSKREAFRVLVEKDHRKQTRQSVRRPA